MNWQTGRLVAPWLTLNVPRAPPTSPPKRSRAFVGQRLCIVMGCLPPQHHHAAWRRTNHLTAHCRGLVTAQPHWDAKGQSLSPASDTETYSIRHPHTQSLLPDMNWVTSYLWNQSNRAPFTVMRLFVPRKLTDLSGFYHAVETNEGPLILGHRAEGSDVICPWNVVEWIYLCFLWPENKCLSNEYAVYINEFMSI